MVHVGLHSVGTYHKKFGGQNVKNKIWFAECLYKTLGKVVFTECPVFGTQQRLTAVSFRTAADGLLPSAFFAECLTLGKHVFAECGSVPSVLHSVKRLVTESLLYRVVDKRHSAKRPTLGKLKPRIPVVKPSVN
jgi:hypothetical protein